MTPTFTTKCVSLVVAAMVTLSIMTSLDALARTEQGSVMAASNGITQTACVAAALRT